LGSLNQGKVGQTSQQHFARIAFDCILWYFIWYQPTVLYQFSHKNYHGLDQGTSGALSVTDRDHILWQW